VGFTQQNLQAMLDATEDEPKEGGVSEAELQRQVKAAVKRQQDAQAATLVQLVR